MAIHTPHIAMLAQALKEGRHMTLGEQFMARDILEDTRKAAVLFYGLPYADTRPGKDDAADTAQLKRRGLYEIARFSRDPDAPLALDLRALLLSLIPEAAHDYEHGPRHRIAAPVLPVLPGGKSDALLRGALTDMRARQDASDARLDSLAGDLRALLDVLRPAAPPSTLPLFAAADDESDKKDGAA